MSLIQTIQNSHNNEKHISKNITEISYDEHSLLVIKHPQCNAAISLQGAHLLYWQPTTEQIPAIWLSDKALFKKEIPIRGGIPICWPWFSNGGTPMHGFARIVDWQLTSVNESDDGVDLVLSLTNNEQTNQYWPHIFNLAIKFHIGKTFKAELTCSGEFEATSALHTYFGISDIAAITVTGLGQTYHEKLSTANEPKVIGQMTFNQEVDRIYKEPESITLIKDNNRTIKITHHNNSDIVVWNPWVERAKAMTDLADDSYHHFVCVETSRINKPIKSKANEKSAYSLEIEIVK